MEVLCVYAEAAKLPTICAKCRNILTVVHWCAKHALVWGTGACYPGNFRTYEIASAPFSGATANIAVARSARPVMQDPFMFPVLKADRLEDGQKHAGPVDYVFLPLLQDSPALRTLRSTLV